MTSEQLESFYKSRMAEWRSRAGDGPWSSEPDRVEFEHAGLPCLALRNWHGAWCGYAAVPPGHPWHGLGVMDVDVDVHRGVNYAAKCSEYICHVPKPGEPDDVWWFGFDCGHSTDLVPGMESSRLEFERANPQLAALGAHRLPERYRDLAYVLGETRRLAEQLSQRMAAAV